MRAAGLPRLLRDTAAAWRANADRVDGLADRAARLGLHRERAEFVEGAVQNRDGAAALDRAVRYWVSPDMTAVAADAALDCPAIRAEDCPAQSGVFAFGQLLPGLSTEIVGGLYLRDGVRTDIHHTAPVPVDALLWDLAGGELIVTALVQTDRLPHPVLGVDSPLTMILRARTRLPATLTGVDRLVALGPEGTDVDGDQLGPLALLSACWVLMATPTVAARTVVDGRGGGPVTRRTRDDDHVTLVDLRPLRQVDEPTGTGRPLASRHVVRGHWTHQPYGPGRTARRLQWIAPYIRGPEGTPLITRDQVMVWRR